MFFPGLKQIRVHSVGLKNYFSETHVGNSMAAMHDHANNIRTIGMGEFVGVLNGVEFRTRHNDYRLYMSPNGTFSFKMLFYVVLTLQNLFLTTFTLSILYLLFCSIFILLCDVRHQQGSEYIALTFRSSSTFGT